MGLLQVSRNVGFIPSFCRLQFAKSNDQNITSKLNYSYFLILDAFHYQILKYFLFGYISIFLLYHLAIHNSKPKTLCGKEISVE